MRSFGAGAGAALMAAWIMSPAPERDLGRTHVVAQQNAALLIEDFLAAEPQPRDDWRALRRRGGVAQTVGFQSAGDFFHGPRFPDHHR